MIASCMQPRSVNISHAVPFHIEKQAEIDFVVKKIYEAISKTLGPQ